MGSSLFDRQNRELAEWPRGSDLPEINPAHGLASAAIGRVSHEAQIENSPDIDTRKPVSRQHEAEYSGYYGYPYYWGGPYLWEPGDYPARIAQPSLHGGAAADRIRKESMDSHLRSTEAVTGYHIESKDGEIGHVDDFIIDDEAWAIRYIEAGTKNW